MLRDTAWDIKERRHRIMNNLQQEDLATQCVFTRLFQEWNPKSWRQCQKWKWLVSCLIYLKSIYVLFCNTEEGRRRAGKGTSDWRVVWNPRWIGELWKRKFMLTIWILNNGGEMKDMLGGFTTNITRKDDGTWETIL